MVILITSFFIYSLCNKVVNHVSMRQCIEHFVKYSLQNPLNRKASFWWFNSFQLLLLHIFHAPRKFGLFAFTILPSKIICIIKLVDDKPFRE